MSHVTVKVVIDNDDDYIDIDDDDENDDDYESHFLQYIITIMIIVYHLDQHIRQLYAACSCCLIYIFTTQGVHYLKIAVVTDENNAGRYSGEKSARPVHTCEKYNME
jgi:hypothetical protein